MSGNIKDKVISILTTLKQLPNNPAVLEDADILSFIISLIPIPGVEQVGQIANKIVSEQQLKVKLSEIKDQILTTNERITTLESDIERVGEIANTAASVTKIQKSLDQFIALLAELLNNQGSEFIVETSDRSIQAVISQLIEVDWVSISAANHSKNIFKHTKIKARRTHLKAHNNSMNIIDGTEFSGHDGSVSMNNISQEGDIEISGASVGFGEGGALMFGARPTTVEGNCPRCNFRIVVEAFKLQGYSSIQCPSCFSILPFRVN